MNRAFFVAALLTILSVATVARADIFQWEYINPANPSQGKRQSTTLAPGGAGVDAVPSADLTFRNLTMAYLIGADLPDIDGRYVNLTNADLSQANLTNAYFAAATLTDADFTGADVRGARFDVVFVRGFKGTGIRLEQLYSTASYLANDLSGIGLHFHSLAGGNFVNQNLTGVDFGGATLTDADFTGADIRGANLGLRSYGVCPGAICPERGTGVTLAQIYSTVSYQAHDLSGVSLYGSNLAGGDFAGKNLTNGSFGSIFATNLLAGTDLSAADARGARFYSDSFYSLADAITTKLIRPDGHIAGLNLAAGEKLVAYPGVPIPVHVSGEFSIAPDATFDLTDNDLIVRATAQTKDALHAEIHARIKSAHSGLDANGLTNWSGPGITSSSARATNVAAGLDHVGLGVIRNSDLDITTGLPGSSYITFSGQSVTPDDVLVKYTYIGDGNLDGVVSFDDYVGMDNAFSGLIPNLGWATGDINFDGAINFDDYTVVDQAFFFQAEPLTHADVSAVPEPSTFGLFAIGGAAILAIRLRRRAKRRYESQTRYSKRRNQLTPGNGNLEVAELTKPRRRRLGRA